MNEQANARETAAISLSAVRLRSAAQQIFLYRRMVDDSDAGAQPGDLVRVVDPRGATLGTALYNPRSLITLRMLTFSDEPVDDEFWKLRVEEAVHLRRTLLKLDDHTDAYRVVHAEGDELSGLVADRYGDVLSCEFFSAAMWQQRNRILPHLHAALGTRHHRLLFDDRAARLEKVTPAAEQSEQLPREVVIQEQGVRYRIQFAAAHKTGFFCDQRENRARFASFCANRRVLDLCSYTGGFGITARVLGDAREVTCVDLDETAVAAARKNADLNQVRVKTVHADAFKYARQMQENDNAYEAVVLDPPKLVFGKSEAREGRQKYFDLNRLAAGLVAPGGILLTCSCSGGLPRAEFEKIVFGAVRHAERRAQLIAVSGAAADHPVSPRCPESEYLKALWLRIV